MSGGEPGWELESAAQPGEVPYHGFWVAQVGEPPAAYRCRGCGRAWPGKAAPACRCQDPEAPDFEAWQTWTPARPYTWGMLIMAAWRAWRARRRGWQGWVQLGATTDTDGYGLTGCPDGCACGPCQHGDCGGCVLEGDHE